MLSFWFWDSPPVFINKRRKLTTNLVVVVLLLFPLCFAEEESSSRQKKQQLRVPSSVGNVQQQQYQRDERGAGIRGLDVVAAAVEDFPLDFQSVKQNKKANRRILLRDWRDQKFSVDEAEPLTDLFSSEHFTVSDDGTSVTNLRSNETFAVPVFRSLYENGTALQVLTDGTTGDVQYAEIRHHPDGAANDTFFLRAMTGSDSVLKSFDSIGVFEPLNLQEYSYGEAALPSWPALEEDSTRRTLTQQQRDLLPKFVYRRGDRSSAECTYFKVVNLAIVYDAEFCQHYGSAAAARNRIVAVVASASLYYERDMCVKLRLTDIYTPDTTCRSPSSTFGGFTRSRLCGSVLPHFLNDFSTWMSRTRRSLGINSNSLVHLMTGSASPDGKLGCAWLGTMCWNSFSYGIEYMTFRENNVATQGVILAHEIGVSRIRRGSSVLYEVVPYFCFSALTYLFPYNCSQHNIHASHFESSDKEYIMESRLSRGTDGFSQASVESILSFLDSVSCDDTELAQPTPTSPPPPPPTRRPTLKPNPSPRPPTRRPTEKPIPVPPPSKPPVPAPTKRPSSKPTPTPISNDGDEDCEASGELCVIEDKKKDAYACFSPDELLESQYGPSSSCPARVSIQSIVSCDGTPYRANPISLEVNSAVENEGAKDKVKGKKEDKKKDDKDKDKKDEDDDGKEDNGLESFVAGVCSRSCIVVGEYVCFLPFKDSVHSVKVTTKNQVGATESFETTVVVRNKKDDNANGCREAKTKCND